MSAVKTMTVAATAAIAIGGGLFLTGSGGSEMPLAEDALHGRWVKAEGAGDCAASYPSNVEFMSGGIYAAPDGPAEGAIWHGGDWTLSPDDGKLRIQAANDAMRAYDVMQRDDETLVFTDDAGCTISYARVAG